LAGGISNAAKLPARDEYGLSFKATLFDASVRLRDSVEADAVGDSGFSYASPQHSWHISRLLTDHSGCFVREGVIE
jgi:hypothetical protein